MVQVKKNTHCLLRVTWHGIRKIRGIIIISENIEPYYVLGTVLGNIPYIFPFNVNNSQMREESDQSILGDYDWAGL